MDAELRKDVRRVMPHRVRTHPEERGAFTIRGAPSEEPQSMFSVDAGGGMPGDAVIAVEQLRDRRLHLEPPIVAVLVRQRRQDRREASCV
jgi:hypothetical protein